MRRWLLFLPLFGLVLVQSGLAQDSRLNPPSPSNAPTDSPKPKKIYTNDDLNDKSVISVVGDPRNQKYTPSPPKSADSAATLKMKASLEKLQEQLDDLNKQLAALGDFQKGDSVSKGGYPLNKGYTRVPVDQQIIALGEKKKKIETQMDAILEEARKKGVEPGQLR
jgi:phage I-like protein